MLNTRLLGSSFGPRLQHGFTVDQGLTERLDRGWVWLQPHSAMLGFQQPLGDRVQRPRIALLKEFLHARIERIRLSDLLVHPVVNDAGGGVEAEQVIDRRAQFQPPFVAVPPYALDPLGVDDARAENPQHLLLEVADGGARRVVSVAEIMLRLAARQGADGGDHATVELQVIVAVEDVMLAVVLVVQRDLHTDEPPSKQVAGVDALLVDRVRIAAPVNVCFRQVGGAIPVLLVDQRQDPRTVALRLGTEDAVRSLPLEVERTGLGACGRFHVRQEMLAREILAGRLIQLHDQPGGLVQECDQVGKGVAEETADAHDDVDPRPAKLLEWDHLDAGDPPAFFLPAGVVIPLPTKAHRQRAAGAFVVVQCQNDLLEIVRALETSCRLSCRLHGRQEQRDEYRDNRNDNQELDQCEAASGRESRAETTDEAGSDHDNLLVVRSLCEAQRESEESSARSVGVSCRSINRLARKAKSDVQSRRPYPTCRGFIIASTPRPGRTLREPTMGRSSGSRINLQATPSHGFQCPQWPMWRSSPVTAAGPQRICTVFPLLRIWISFPDRHPCRAQSYQDKLGRQATRSFSSRPKAVAISSAQARSSGRYVSGAISGMAAGQPS